MTEKEYNRVFGRLMAGNLPDHETIMQLIDVVNTMEDLLDEGDYEDAFGTEGWRVRVFSN